MNWVTAICKIDYNILRNAFCIFYNELFLFDGEPQWLQNYFEWMEFPGYKSSLKTPQDKTDKGDIRIVYTVQN